MVPLSDCANAAAANKNRMAMQHTHLNFHMEPPRNTEALI
jgi:hypothetical protein